MAEHQKGKTKAAILQELESIKGLLLEDEDIPLLQEVIDTAEEQTGTEESLGDDDLAELQQAYRDLLQAHESQEDSSPETPNAEETSPPQGSPASGDKPEVQVSLFDADTSSDEQPQTRPAISDPSTRRSTVTKASGENPFLPAHIRSRLHGNRPPPLLQPDSALVRASTKAGEDTGHALSRRQLIDELVASILPQVETELRQRLQHMTDKQLQVLHNPDTSEPNAED